MRLAVLEGVRDSAVKRRGSTLVRGKYIARTGTGAVRSGMSGEGVLDGRVGESLCGGRLVYSV